MSIADTIETPAKFVWYLIILAIVMLIALMIFLPDSTFLLSKLLSIFRVG